MWECLKSVLLLMASRGPAPLVMNMSLHLSSFMNSQSFFLIFLRCSRTLHHVQLVDCNVNSPRRSLHCKKQTINRQTRGFLMDGLHLMTKFTLCNWQMWKGGPLGHVEVALLKWVNKHTSKYSMSRILSKLKLCPFIFLLENHCPWNACTMLMHTDWPVTVLHHQMRENIPFQANTVQLGKYNENITFKRFWSFWIWKSEAYGRIP